MKSERNYSRLSYDDMNIKIFYNLSKPPSHSWLLDTISVELIIICVHSGRTLPTFYHHMSIVKEFANQSDQVQHRLSLDFYQLSVFAQAVQIMLWRDEI